MDLNRKMKKIRSKDKLDTYIFHDCFILDAKFLNTTLVLDLKHVNVLKTNSENLTGRPKQTCKAVFSINGYKIIKITEQLSTKINQSGIRKGKAKYLNRNLENNDILEILKGAEISYCFMIEDNYLQIEIHGKYTTSLIVIEITYKDCEMGWDEFVCDAWFYREKE